MSRSGGSKACPSCRSKDPEWQAFAAIQTTSYLCSQTFQPIPYAGVHRHMIRGAYNWWTEMNVAPIVVRSSQSVANS